MAAHLQTIVARISGPRWVYGGAAAIVVLHIVLAVAGTWNKSATFDETAYVGNGFSFWATGDYRMSPDAILPQRWMTLPVYLGGYIAPSTDNNVWFNGDVWGYGMDLLFRSGNDGQAILRTARFMTTLLSAVLAAITFFWAKQLCGTAGGFVALVLYALNPSILAHGSNASSDLAASLAFTASVWALWTVLHRLTPWTVAVSCLVVGCAFVTKLSAVLLVPIGLLMAIVQLVGRRPMQWRLGRRSGELAAWWQRLLVLGPLVAAHVLVAWIMIWGMFGFRYESLVNTVDDRDRSYFGTWDEAFEKAKNPLPGQTEDRNQTTIPIVQWARDHRLLPEGYLLNFLNSLTTTAVRSCFLDGRYGIYGFASFFPLCFLYKTPPAVFLALFVAGLTHIVRRIYQLRVERRRAWPLLWNGFYVTSPLWILGGLYWIASITRGINIGLRHILPTFPATFILAGLAGVWLCGWRRRRPAAPIESPPAAELTAEPAPVVARPAAVPESATFLTSCSPQLRAFMCIVVAGSLFWQVLDTAFAGGNYLAYFNVMSGGSDNGYVHLVDSSLDWGQELYNLKRWIDERGDDLPPNIYVSYFGTTPPSTYDLKARWLPGYMPIESLEPGETVAKEVNLQEGIYCISATSLQCVYNGNYAGPWRDDYEQHYKMLNTLILAYMQTQDKPADREAALKATGLPNWSTAFTLFEQARFGRLCEYLRRREPDESINHAILIYRLSMQDLRQGLLNPPVEHYPAPKEPGDNVPY